jgi:hypothetical protein
MAGDLPLPVVVQSYGNETRVVLSVLLDIQLVTGGPLLVIMMRS